MTLYEILTLLVALVGAVTGVASLIRTRTVERKSLEFQAIAASLRVRFTTGATGRPGRVSARTSTSNRHEAPGSR